MINNKKIFKIIHTRKILTLLLVLAVGILLYLGCGDVEAADTGWKSPSAIGEWDQWTNGANAFSSDNSYTTNPGSSRTEYYKNFNFGIPSSVIINGIEVSIEAKQTQQYDENMQLQIRMSGDAGDSFCQSQWPAWKLSEGEVTKTVGGPSWLWEYSWTASSFSDSNFRLAMSNGPDDSVWSVDHIQVKVYYTPIVSPTVTTQAVDNIEKTTATGHGNITNTGGQNCDKRGVCWNTTGNPTIADNKSEETGSFGTGAFTRDMTGLSPEITYYVKAYAHNSAGYSYGGEQSFTTQGMLAVTTNPASNIQAHQAQLNGDLTNMGGADSCNVWFQWGLTDSYGNEAPVPYDSMSSTGTFDEVITELIANTTYHFRAVAENPEGIIYGDDQQFTTSLVPSEFHNWAWSDMIMGWLSFNDKDYDGAPGPVDYQVMTSVGFLLNQPPHAAISCDGSECGAGSQCNGTWVAYNTDCVYKINNDATDPDGQSDIAKSTWSIFYGDGSPWQDPYLTCTADPLCDLTLPTLTSGNYKVKLAVEDQEGESDSIIHDFTMKQGAVAGFTCSLNEEGPWVVCDDPGFKPTIGEIVYFNDNSGIADNYSIASSGASITSRKWERVGDPSFDTANNSITSTVLTDIPSVVKLTITDSVGRSASVSNSISVGFPLPEWKEVAP